MSCRFPIAVLPDIRNFDNTVAWILISNVSYQKSFNNPGSRCSSVASKSRLSVREPIASIIWDSEVRVICFGLGEMGGARFWTFTLIVVVQAAVSRRKTGEKSSFAASGAAAQQLAKVLAGQAFDVTPISAQSGSSGESEDDAKDKDYYWGMS